ncbi:hypothetical protein SAMD00023353_0201650 [Rosellinia necatrix]|uniref:Uncharacterized protein n=1 Tax=Rosellinia necatrix TaxID=77044 RepID=A0A1S8A584_ROSNE|nr:hypothetical protein SAMD00023353_0201650 [Rosellinia necatrix]
MGCDEHGKFSKSANEGASRFIFRGEDVDAFSTSSGLAVEKSNVQGSSVVTAIATGVASLFLACYNMVKSKLHRDPN